MISVTRRELGLELLRSAEPVIISDGLVEWPAYKSWSPQFLASLIGGKPVDVMVSLTGVYRHLPDGSAADPANQFVIPDVPMLDAVEYIADKLRAYPKYYIAQFDIERNLPELLKYLCFPRFSNSSRINLWFGSSGTVTPLHFDESYNLYAQIYGSKRFRVYSPTDKPYLYPYPERSRLSHLSYIDAENRDLNTFPLLEMAREFSFTLSAGQLLFLPPLWWHHVRAESISISASQWWL
jgi:hypothetical protein